jgi:hypothetical protein
MGRPTKISKDRAQMIARRLLGCAAVALLVAAASAVPASANEGIAEFSVHTSDTQAGAHPNLETIIALENAGQPEAARDIAVNLPEGVFGNPNAAEKCTSQNFALMQCANTSQIGTVTVHANYEGEPKFLLGTAPLYVLEPRSATETARFAFIVPTVDIPINIPISVRTTSDYGLRMTVASITQQIPLASAEVHIWGFPASSEHDNQRFLPGTPGNPAGCPGQATANCASLNGTSPHPSPSLLTPLTDNPTTCTEEPLQVTLDVWTYQDLDHPSHAVSSYPATTGCYNETFNPVFNAALTTDRADSAAGLDLQLKAEQFLGFAHSPSSIKSASLTLPEGVSINPDAADGQRACTDAEVHFNSEGPADCPDDSKIGNFDVETPALDGPLTGSLYFGEPKPGNQYRVFMVASGFGINSKLIASAFPNPRTGQLTMSVGGLPQVPFEQFNLHLFASERGLVATPTHCGIVAAESFFEPWNSNLAPQHSTPNMNIQAGPSGGPCPGQVRPFNPRLVAGTSNPFAGAFSSFYLRLDRDDGDQFLGDLNFRMPPGLTGSLRGISYCPEGSIAAAPDRLGRDELANPSCPSSSQIGTSNVAAGPGSHPFHAYGKIFLAGPFKGAPLSLVVITPALAGPYDYGTVVVRVALHIDPLTAQVGAVSDTVPSIIGGVPIRMRSIQVAIDRSQFTINPTNCSHFAVESQGIGDQGTVDDFSSPFHSVNCRSLHFKPRMTVKLVGRRRAASRSNNPALQLDLRTRPGDANLKAISVTLTNAFEIDQRHLGNICSEKELVEKQCAGRTPIGHATTTTPLLDQPLSGPVYAVSGSGGLPRLAFILDGQVRLIPRADTDTVGGGRLKTTVPVVPDAPIGHFRMIVFGGKRGYLVNTRDLCARPISTRVDYLGQNGKSRSESVKIKTPCGKGSKSPRKRHHHG